MPLKVPYRLMVQKALSKGDTDTAQDVVQNAMQEMGSKLQSFLQGCYQYDLPFVIAALEMAVSCIKSSMDPKDQRLVDSLKQLVCCAAVDLNQIELRKQTRDVEEASEQ